MNVMMSFFSAEWPMSLLLLLKVSQLCLRVPPVYGKMHRGNTLLLEHRDVNHTHMKLSYRPIKDDAYFPIDEEFPNFLISLFSKHPEGGETIMLIKRKALFSPSDIIISHLLCVV